MQRFTITPKLSLEAASSVILPENLPVKVSLGLLVFAISSAGFAFFWKLGADSPIGDFGPAVLPLAVFGLFAVVSCLSAVLCVTIWIARFWLYERVLKATAARGPITVSREGLNLQRDGHRVLVPWSKIRDHRISSLAVLIVTDAHEHVILPANELVELRVFVDLCRCLDEKAPPAEPTDPP